MYKKFVIFKIQNYVYCNVMVFQFVSLKLPKNERNKIKKLIFYVLKIYIFVKIPFLFCAFILNL